MLETSASPAGLTGPVSPTRPSASTSNDTCAQLWLHGFKFTRNLPHSTSHSARSSSERGCTLVCRLLSKSHAGVTLVRLPPCRCICMPVLLNTCRWISRNEAQTRVVDRRLERVIGVQVVWFNMEAVDPQGLLRNKGAYFDVGGARHQHGRPFPPQCLVVRHLNLACVLQAVGTSPPRVTRAWA